jgi:hypothetical protein
VPNSNGLSGGETNIKLDTVGVVWCACLRLADRDNVADMSQRSSFFFVFTHFYPIIQTSANSLSMSPCLHSPTPNSSPPKPQKFPSQWVGGPRHAGPLVTPVSFGRCQSVPPPPLTSTRFSECNGILSVSVQATRHGQSRCMPREPSWIVKLLHQYHAKVDHVVLAWSAGYTL